MVSKYSKNPEAGADLVRFLCSAPVQKQRAIELTQFPTRPDLYKDPEVLAKNKWFGDILVVLENAVARPSTVTGSDYNQVSTAIFQNVNKVMSGGESAQDAVAQIERTAKRVVR